MTDSEIDDAVMASAEKRWQKVAMIVCVAAQKLYGKSPLSEAEYNAIGTRIEVLVKRRRLEAQGDVTRWRFSEIRLPRDFDRPNQS